MKKLILIILSFFAISIQAQHVFLKMDAGIGTALSFGDLRAYGISASIEPKVFITNNISAGLRIEGDVLFGGHIPVDNASELTVGMSARAATLVKGEYYLTDMKVRLFGGLGMGMYTQANVAASGTGSASITASRNFGVAPELGVTLGNFRLSAIYNLVAGKDLIEISVGNFQEVRKNYVVLQLGWKVFSYGD